MDGCMFVDGCMDGWIDVCGCMMYGCMFVSEWMYGWMDVWMFVDVCMYGWMIVGVWMYGCMCVGECIGLQIQTIAHQLLKVFGKYGSLVGEVIDSGNQIGQVVEVALLRAGIKGHGGGSVM